MRVVDTLPRTEKRLRASRYLPDADIQTIEKILFQYGIYSRWRSAYVHIFEEDMRWHHIQGFTSSLISRSGGYCGKSRVGPPVGGNTPTRSIVRSHILRDWRGNISVPTDVVPSKSFPICTDSSMHKVDTLEIPPLFIQLRSGDSAASGAHATSGDGAGALAALFQCQKIIQNWAVGSLGHVDYEKVGDFVFSQRWVWLHVWWFRLFCSGRWASLPLLLPTLFPPTPPISLPPTPKRCPKSRETRRQSPAPKWASWGTW